MRSKSPIKDMKSLLIRTFTSCPFGQHWCPGTRRYCVGSHLNCIIMIWSKSWQNGFRCVAWQHPFFCIFSAIIFIFGIKCNFIIPVWVNENKVRIRPVKPRSVKLKISGHECTKCPELSSLRLPDIHMFDYVTE